MLLTPCQLRFVRQQQPQECPSCHASILMNYCRDCDEFFDDGHHPACTGSSLHSSHRNYRTFSGTTISSLAELEAEAQGQT